MTITSILTMIVIGLAIGSLGRLFVPGRVPIPIWLTMVVGVGAGFAGTLLARALGVPTATSGIDWIELFFQVVLAAAGVAAVAGFYGRRAAPADSSPARIRRDSPPATAWSPPPTPGTSAGWAPSPRSTAQGAADRSGAPPTRIFVSYRRTDSPHAARGIAKHLRDRFGRSEVFMDVDSLDPGVDFVSGVLEAIRGSAVVLVLIGEQWLRAQDDRGRRRLDDPGDHVRVEVEQALRWRKPVLPVLLDGAAMPRPDELPTSLAPVSRLNAVHIGHVSWDADIEALIRVVAGKRP